MLGHTVTTPTTFVIVVTVGVVGLAVAAGAYRRSSPVLGLLVVEATESLASPVSWSHHFIWVVLLVAWLALAPDRPALRRVVRLGGGRARSGPRRTGGRRTGPAWRFAGRGWLMPAVGLLRARCASRWWWGGDPGRALDGRAPRARRSARADGAVGRRDLTRGGRAQRATGRGRLADQDERVRPRVEPALRRGLGLRDAASRSRPSASRGRRDGTRCAAARRPRGGSRSVAARSAAPRARAASGATQEGRPPARCRAAARARSAGDRAPRSPRASGASNSPSQTKSEGAVRVVARAAERRGRGRRPRGRRPT